jgi:arginine repressor
MAKRKVNKTQAVKEYLKAHRKASNQEVAEALTKAGIKITAGHVANIKSKLKKRRRAAKKVVAKRGVGIPEIKAALALLKVTGNVEAASQALAAAQEIKELV